MSLDGFIAGPSGDMGWLVDYMGGTNKTVDAVVPQIGALLVGKRTWGGDDPFKGTPAEGEAYGGAWHGPQFVVTHHPPAAPVEDVTFLTDLPSAIDASARAAGDRYVSILGADIAAQCLAAGVLDEVLVTIVPIMLGDGVPLFRAAGPAVKLDVIDVVYEPPSTTIWSRIIRP
jgi:dihydrofolate reductase